MMIKTGSNGELEIDSNEVTVSSTLGKGSFGVVKKGLWRGTDVALKIISNTDVIDYTEFQREFEILSRLHHPNVLQLLGACTTHVPHMIIMEYMANGSLDNKMNELKYNQKIDILKDISKGLAYLHHRKPDCIIHRDLKPSNILLSVSLKAKIADFGISSLLKNADDTFNMTGETGTYRYMAPEVFKHQSYGTKVDVWSFGMILYHMFGEQPFEGMKLHDMFECIRISNIPIRWDLLSKELRILLKNSIEIDAQKRWDSMYIVNYCNNDINYERNGCFFCFNLKNYRC